MTQPGQTTAGTRTSRLDWTSVIPVLVGANDWGLLDLGTYVNVNWNPSTAVSVGSPPWPIALLGSLAGVAERDVAFQRSSVHAAPRSAQRKAAPEARTVSCHHTSCSGPDSTLI